MASRCYSSAAVIELAVAKRAIGIGGIDSLDDFAADCIAEVQAERNAVLPLIVPADVIKSREGVGPVRSPSVETECPGLKRATARVPQVIFIAQPESVHVAPDRKFLGWPQHHFAEEVRIVHGVEERKARVDARSGKNGEKGAVGVVSGIPIAARIGIAAAKP